MWHGQPLLWARIDGYWDQCVLVRGPADVRGALPQLTAPDVRAVGHEPGTPVWWEAWARQWGRMLVDASESVLYTGRWCLRPVRAISADQAPGHAISTMEWSFGQPPLPPHSLDAVLRFRPAWVENWREGIPDQKPGTVLPLRAPSDAEDGRIKSWRKRARDGTLPPAWQAELRAWRRWSPALLEADDWDWLVSDQC